MRAACAAALLLALTTSAHADPISILAFGQSGMAGQFGPIMSDGIYSRDFQAWDVTSNGWVTASLGTQPFSSGSTNNLAFVFAKEVARYCEAEIRMVLIASGGKKIEYFLPTVALSAHGWTNSQSSALYGSSAAEELMGVSPYGDAIPALQSLGASRYDIAIMHQGEANAVAGDSSATYEAKLSVLLDELDARGLIDLTGGGTSVLLGHINAAYAGAANQASAIESFASGYANVSTVAWAGIATRQPYDPNDYHATGLGLEQLGVRYFREWVALSGGVCP